METTSAGRPVTLCVGRRIQVLECGEEGARPTSFSWNVNGILSRSSDYKLRESLFIKQASDDICFLIFPVFTANTAPCVKLYQAIIPCHQEPNITWVGGLVFLCFTCC